MHRPSLSGSMGHKRKSAGGEEDDAALVADEPLWRLSLGSIYGGLADPAMNRQPCLQVAQALPVSLSRHTLPSSSPAAVNLVAHVQMTSAGAAFDAVEVGQVVSSPSLFDGGSGASPLLVATAATIHLTAKQAPAPPLIKQDEVEVEPLASPDANLHSALLRVTSSGLLLQPAAAVEGEPAANNGTTTVPSPSTNGSPPPFPWATNHAAFHHPIATLFERGITAVEGEVKCKRCDAQKTVSYDIAAKFREVYDFVARDIHDMDDRAPPVWMFPVFPDCDGCGQRNSLRPVVPPEKERINWVFLLLGQTLGHCTLEQLKYFCAQTGNHRTGAKDRVLYSSYMELCRQLSPDRLFNLSSERQKRGQQYS